MDEERQEFELFKQLQTAPKAEILGIVDALGVGVTQFQGQKDWTLTFDLSGWKQRDGELQSNQLQIRQRCSERKINELQKKIAPYDVVCLTVHLPNSTASEIAFGLLVKFHGRVEDDLELNALSLKLQEPITKVDDRFGIFTLDRRTGMLKSQAIWNDTSIELVIENSKPEKVEKLFEIARKLWDAQKGWQSKGVAYALENVLPLKNEGWRRDGEAEVTPEELLKRINIEAIWIYEDCQFAFNFNDGELFFHHSIDLLGNLTDGFVSFDLIG